MDGLVQKQQTDQEVRVRVLTLLLFFTMTDKEQLERQLDALKEFPNIREVKALRKRIKKQLEKFAKKPVKIRKKKLTPYTRSSKMRKYWRYIRMIRNNFPGLTISEIRRQFSKRRKGTQVNIPDVIWQNPSP